MTEDERKTLDQVGVILAEIDKLDDNYPNDPEDEKNNMYRWGELRDQLIVLGYACIYDARKWYNELKVN